jgi:BirA family transcriptional regulator, biotin operon repressor / biotin---[acetyl-CoA-carboxylase] ligase
MQPSAAGFFRIFALQTIDSTSEEAKRLSCAGAAEGTLVWAARQTSGHGRFGRIWVSPPGNLYFTLLLRPRRPARETMQLTFVAALAVVDAISEALPPDAGGAVTCKWPNDVLISGRKVAGILLESSTDGAGDVDSLVIGIGVNVESHPPPEELRYPATSLRAEGAPEETTGSLLERFCRSFLARYEEWRRRGFSPARKAWLARAEGLHRRIEVRLEGTTAAGIFADLDPTGALVLRQEGGQRLILAGDVFPAEV